jgi:hypothetical protein
MNLIVVDEPWYKELVKYVRPRVTRILVEEPPEGGVRYTGIFDNGCQRIVAVFPSKDRVCPPSAFVGLTGPGAFSLFVCFTKQWDLLGKVTNPAAPLLGAPDPNWEEPSLKHWEEPSLKLDGKTFSTRR